MTESPLLNSWLQQAADRRGLEQERGWLLDCLQQRFPAELTSEVVETINAQPSFPVLEVWYKAAIRAQTYEDFLVVLSQ